ncbi:MAG: hypothetical protein NTV21_04745 [Planctomycetota bacterium]|nr:hypothetical protein [Planctomycetota bacterium]
MQTPDDLDPYRSPRSETTQADTGAGTSGQPLPWEPLDSYQFAFKQLRAYPMAILFAFVAVMVASVIGGIGGLAQAALGASPDEGLRVLGWVIYGLCVIVNVPIAAWMNVGQARCALAMMRGQRPEFSVLFALRGTLSAIGAQILYSVGLMLVGGVLLGPGLVVLFNSNGQSPAGPLLLIGGALPFMALAIFLAVKLTLLNVVAADRASGVFETLGRSWQLTTGAFWLFVLFVLLMMATQIVAFIGGLLLCCVGVMVTVPAGVMLIQLATADAYLKRTGERPVGLA